jgi:hypothetical protein
MALKRSQMLKRCDVAMGHKRTLGVVRLMSAPRKRTWFSTVAMSALCQKQTYAVQQITTYSITSSAIAMTPDGIVSPSALAVFRLMTNSNLEACITGRSAGLSPLRILPTYRPAWR